jgi:hypothetical protein
MATPGRRKERKSYNLIYTRTPCGGGSDGCVFLEFEELAEGEEFLFYFWYIKREGVGNGRVKEGVRRDWVAYVYLRNGLYRPG